MPRPRPRRIDPDDGDEQFVDGDGFWNPPDEDEEDGDEEQVEPEPFDEGPVEDEAL